MRVDVGVLQMAPVVNRHQVEGDVRQRPRDIFDLQSRTSYFALVVQEQQSFSPSNLFSLRQEGNVGHVNVLHKDIERECL